MRKRVASSHRKARSNMRANNPRMGRRTMRDPKAIPVQGPELKFCHVSLKYWGGFQRAPTTLLRRKACASARNASEETPVLVGGREGFPAGLNWMTPAGAPCEF